MMFKNNVLTTRRETADIWQSQNPILNEMELGVEIVLNQDRTVSHYNIKLGDGLTPWNSLDYFYEDLDDKDTNEILDDFTINLATKKPAPNRIPIYDDDAGLKSGKTPIEDDDVVRLKEFKDVTADTEQLEQNVSDLTDALDTHESNTSAHGATAEPVASKMAMYNDDTGLKSGKIPTENNDVVRFLEFNNEVSSINSKIATLNGAYYVLDSYNFGEIIDETNPDDITTLNTYAIANTPGASSMADVYDDTVIVNGFDSAEYVYNKIAGMWVKYPNGYLTIATNNHLGVVKGTQPPDDPEDESKDTYVQVLADGTMKLVGDRLGGNNYPPVGEDWKVGTDGNGNEVRRTTMAINNPTLWDSASFINLGIPAPAGFISVVDYFITMKSTDILYDTTLTPRFNEIRLGKTANGNLGGYLASSIGGMIANSAILYLTYVKSV